MSKRSNVFEKCKFSAEEALNIIISEEYTLGTSSSDDSSSESSDSDYTTDTNSQSPSPKVNKKARVLYAELFSFLDCILVFFCFLLCFFCLVYVQPLWLLYSIGLLP